MTWIIYRQKALDQIERQLLYYAEHAPHVQQIFRDDIDTVTKPLKRFPDMGRLGDVQGTREILSQKFKYFIVYRHKDSQIEVLRFYFRGQSRP